MIEAERFLKEKQNRGKQTASPPDLPANPAAPCGSAQVQAGTSTASLKLETRWLNFVNYILVPANVVLCVIGLYMVGSEPEMRPFVIGYVVNIVITVALFFGLRNRTPWGWWLMMAVLALKAPSSAYHRYSLACLHAEIMNGLKDMGYSVASSMRVDVAEIVRFALFGFVFICLPQMIYFYKRRGLFNA